MFCGILIWDVEGFDRTQISPIQGRERERERERERKRERLHTCYTPNSGCLENVVVRPDVPNVREVPFTKTLRWRAMQSSKRFNNPARWGCPEIGTEAIPSSKSTHFLYTCGGQPLARS